MSPFTDVRGGLITVGLYLLLLLSIITPLGVISLWFIPLPFFWFSAKNGWKSALFPVTICGILSLLVGPTMIAAWLFATGIGLLMGELYRKPESTGTDVVLGGWVATWLGVLGLLLFATWMFDGLGQFQSMWQQQWESTQQTLENYGLNAVDMEEAPSLNLVLPIMMFFITIPFPLFNFLLGRRLLMRQGLPGKYLPPIREWRLPRPFFYFYFIALLLLLLFGLEGGTISFIAGTTVTLMFLIFFVQGLAFSAFLLHRWNRGNGWVVLVGVLALLIPLFSFFIHLLGIVDTGTEWRKRMESKK
ncbi:DUF2232 domain-containing protein [Desmospora activa]|uniref:Uncharacterized protein YybS (DUF2232 family) n=1 Tax=Desmospora activa DSM 45169 TaxID=1121389 RepID=A0A2T4Z4R8_9BACL|nr:DUF2232 domain-containing protein [Desmospora activa]PTM56883.1 uncharacterized protein YybS (DUF2232 family) [Desmospora activa DSM 45169]